jgi:RNA polymerase sigma-70 factor (ECF subfamily)
MGSTEDLVSAFVAAAPAGLAPDRSTLGSALDALFRAGRAAWPALAVDEVAFATFVAERSGTGKLPSEAYAADLYLACACVHRVDGAMDAFCRAFAAPIERAVGRVDSSAAFVDDARQALHERLFVGPNGGAGKIAAYKGRSALGTWVHVTATRLAINLRIHEGARSKALPADDAVPAVSPELEYLRRRYRSAFEAAVEVGVKRLSSQERALLRHHFVDGMSIDRLGERFAIGRSTAARWLAAARQALLSHTHEELRTRLKLSVSEIDSLANLIRSRIDLSLAKLLREPD